MSVIINRLAFKSLRGFFVFNVRLAPTQLIVVVGLLAFVAGVFMAGQPVVADVTPQAMAQQGEYLEFWWLPQIIEDNRILFHYSISRPGQYSVTGDMADGDSAKSAIEILNELGAEGWELVIQERVGDIPNDSWRYLLKRPA